MKKGDKHPQLPLSFEKVYHKGSIDHINNVICFERARANRCAASTKTKEKEVIDKIVKVAARFKW